MSNTFLTDTALQQRQRVQSATASGRNKKREAKSIDSSSYKQPYGESTLYEDPVELENKKVCCFAKFTVSE